MANKRVTFTRAIEAMWPDPEMPAWMICRLACGHHTYQPKGNQNKACHCGVCMLNHESHRRELAAFEKRQETTTKETTPA